MVEPNIEGAKKLRDFDANDWMEQIKKALKDGYSGQKPHKTEEELWWATDRVIITTAKCRYSFMLGIPPKRTINLVGTGAPFRSYGYVFKKGRIEKHWQWLSNDYQNEIKWSGYDYLEVQKHGIGSGKPKTPTHLPFQQNLA